MKALRVMTRDAAEASGFGADVVEKVIRLVELLGAVCEEDHVLLRESLALKGGTALNLCFGPPSRLSVDLDFDFVGAPSRDAMLQQRPAIESSLELLADSAGYIVDWTPEGHAGRKVLLRYTNLAGGADRVEIDINYLHRVPLRPLEERAVGSLAGVPAVRARTVSLDELIIGKLLALLDRMAPRDFFDAANFPRIAPGFAVRPMWRRLFVAMSGTLPHPLHSYTRERLARLPERLVEDQLWPMLRADVRPTATDLVDRAWAAVQSLVDLTESEREYCDHLQLGELRPELLFGDDRETADWVSQHPALRWKAQNARMHRRRRG